MQLGELGNQPGDGVSLVVAVGRFAGIGAGRIHEGDHGHGAAGVLANDLDGAQVMLRHPHAAVPATLLGQNADAPPRAVAEIERHLGGVQRAHVDFAQHLATQPANDPARAGPVGIFRRVDHGGDISVHIEGAQRFDAGLDGGRGQDAAQVDRVRTNRRRETGIIARLPLSHEKKRVNPRAFPFQGRTLNSGLSRIFWYGRLGWRMRFSSNSAASDPSS